jgi:hypothetical protein
LPPSAAGYRRFAPFLIKRLKIQPQSGADTALAKSDIVATHINMAVKIDTGGTKNRMKRLITHNQIIQQHITMGMIPSDFQVRRSISPNRQTTSL